MPRKRQGHNVGKARQLRKTMTLPETLLWNLLRRSPGGVRFRRQHGIENYVLDFYCTRAKLCVEINGIAHDMGDNPEHDETRDAWLEGEGIEVMRIPATEVLKCPEDVAEALVRYCQR